MHSPDRPSPPPVPLPPLHPMRAGEERGGSIRGGERYPGAASGTTTTASKRKRSSTLAFGALLAFVALLAPVVYHQQHKHHPVVRHVRDERVVLPRGASGGGREEGGARGDRDGDGLDEAPEDERRAGDVVHFDSRHEDWGLIGGDARERPGGGGRGNPRRARRR